MEKLLAIASLGQRAYGRWLFQRMVLGIIAVAGLTIVVSILVSAMLIAGLYAGYFALLHFGAEPQGAMLIITILAVLITLTSVILVLTGLDHLRRMPETLLRRSPLTSGAIDALDAFINGLTAD